MVDPATKTLFQSLILSANDLRQMTDWPEALIEDYLNLIRNFVLLADKLDIEIDQKLEEMSTDLTDKALVVVDSGFLASLGVQTNGQLIIGSTGNPPSKATLTGTINQITITNGAGSITLSLPQNIHTSASPTFAALTQIGDTINKFTVAADGEWTLHGTARVEKILESMVITGKGVSAPTERTDEAPYLSYTFNINNDTHQTFEAPYSMDYTYESYIKVHWYTHLDQTDDEVNWQAQWNAIPEAGGEPINAGATTDTSGDVNCPIQWEIQETLIETIPANSIAEGDMIGIDVTRIAIIDGTDPTNNSIHVLSIEWEYIANKYGKAL